MPTVVATEVVAKPWSFAQLGGPGNTLTLNGWQAPFGRPRQGPILNAGVSIRRTITYYPDGDTGPMPPTIHVFGTEPKPITLHGRWMDHAIGTLGGAKQMRQQWRDFLIAKQPVRAKWGDVLSYIVFIHDFDCDMEAETQIVWKLTMDVITDEQAPVATFTPPVTTPIDFANQLAAELSPTDLLQTTTLTDFLSQIKGFLGDLNDQIDLLISAINTPFQAVYQIASAISDFETALSSDLVNLSSGLQTVQTGIINLRDATEVAMAEMDILNERTVDLPNGVFSGADVTAMRAAKINQDAQAATVLALIADMQAEIARAQRGTATTAHQAQDGDTWESIAAQRYNNPQGANAIRQANAVRYGQRTQAGKVYNIPKQG